jgi:hypothetical protein
VTNANIYIKKHGKKNVGIHQHGVDTQNFPYESSIKNLIINDCMIGVVHFGRKKMTNFNYDECPYCNSENIEGYETDDLVTAEVDGSVYSNNQQCIDCEKKWVLCFEITSRFDVDDKLIDTFETYWGNFQKSSLHHNTEKGKL